MANRYESLWTPVTNIGVTKADEDELEMPWKANFEEPRPGDPEFHKSGQRLEITKAATTMLRVLHSTGSDATRYKVIDDWIRDEGDDYYEFSRFMDEFLECPDVVKVMMFWQERTSPFLFMAEKHIFASKEQYINFVAKAYEKVGINPPREFDEILDEVTPADEFEQAFRDDWVTYVK